MLKSKLSRLPVLAAGIGLAFFMGYPILYVLSTSLKTQRVYFQEPVRLFTSISFENYFHVIETGFLVFFKNSIFLTFSSVIIVVLLASMASYALVQVDFKINKWISLVIMSGMMIPVHSTLIPIFTLETRWGLINHLYGLALPLIAFALPMSVVITSQFMREIPGELVEAADMDGANHYQIFFRLFFPLLKPAMSTIVIYNGVKIWNEFIFALMLLSNKKNYTVPLGLQAFFGELSVNVPGLLAAIFVSVVPGLTIFLILQERFVKSLTMGAVKG